jgi:hypothetical protein
MYFLHCVVVEFPVLRLEPPSPVHQRVLLGESRKTQNLRRALSEFSFPFVIIILSSSNSKSFLKFLRILDFEQPLDEQLKTVSMHSSLYTSTRKLLTHAEQPSALA